MAKWARRSRRVDNQEVGLEAATLERVRNSSLVDASWRRQSTGAKSSTEAADVLEKRAW
jgi:hypothetical protein